jgi:hypothetical protein
VNYSISDYLFPLIIAKSTFGTSEYSKVKHIGKKKLGKLKKDWLNDDCHFERRNFRKRGIFMGSASGFSLNVLKNSNSLSIGMFGCSLVLPFFNSFQNSCELLDFRSNQQQIHL